VTGFSNMTKAMVDYFAQGNGRKSDTVNLIPGFVEPADMAEIKRMATALGVESILFPDTSNVLNSPLTGKFKMYPGGGVTIDQLKATGSSTGTIALGELGAGAAARALDAKCKVPCQVLNLPIGLHDTDIFIDTLRRMAGVNVPDAINLERGQLVDAISDYHQYLYGKRVALAGDPDQLLALSRFLVALDMKPVYMVSGTPAGKKYVAALKDAVADVSDEVKIEVPGDMFLLHQWIKQAPVDLIIGNTYAKYIAKDEDIPIVRHGFPILDRMGHSYFSTFGYRGAMRLLEKILEVLLDRKDRDSNDIDIELVL
jgi:nitrogenase molybdenum-iron protein beta chain